METRPEEEGKKENNNQQIYKFIESRITQALDSLLYVEPNLADQSSESEDVIRIVRLVNSEINRFRKLF